MVDIPEEELKSLKRQLMKLKLESKLRQNLAKELEVNFIGSIPLDKEIRLNSDLGDPSKLEEKYFDEIVNSFLKNSKLKIKFKT